MKSSHQPASPAARLRLFAVAGVALLYLALIAGMLGRQAWLLDLFAHFRVHYAVGLAALAALLGVLRSRRIALIALLGAVVSFWPAAAYIQTSQSASASAPRTLRVISFNVWYRSADVARIAEYLAAQNADVIVLQEATSAHLQGLRERLASHPFLHAEESLYGAAILSRWPLQSATLRSLASGGVAAAQATLDWDGVRVNLLGVHLHWPLAASSARMRNAELQGLAKLAGERIGPTLVFGDLNVTAWSPWFQELLSASGLHDCARHQGLRPSWPSAAVWLGVRIDHCLASDDWRVLDLRVGPHAGSDHRPLIVDLALAREAL